MFQNRQTAVDARLVVADTQVTAADEGGENSAGTAIILDLKGKENEAMSFFGRYTAADFTTGDETYIVKIQSSGSSTFANTVIDEKAITLPIAATLTGVSRQWGPVTFSPRQRYVRMYIDVDGNTPSLTIDKAYIAPAV